MVMDKQQRMYPFAGMVTEARRDAVYRAISEPTRRRILDLLADRERAVKELVSRFRMSQPALSQHLRVLRGAGLVRVRRQGRMRFYSVDPGPLREVSDWLGRYQRPRPGRLPATGRTVDEG
jgi:DNA-binding transcriptional ArsR family regulator